MNNTQNLYGYAKDGKVYLYAYMNFPSREIGFVKDDNEVQSIDYFAKRFEMAEAKVAELIDAIENSQNKGSYLMKLIHLRQYLTEFNGLGNFSALFSLLDSHEAVIRDYILHNRGKNLEIKTALLKEAEALKESTTWSDSTFAFKELKMKWIKTGSSPSENEEKLNAAFNAAIDYFFTNRNAFVEEKSRVIEERKQAYQTLINQLRKVMSEDTEDRIARIKQLQRDWHEVGKLPKKHFVFYTKIFKNELNNFFSKKKRKQEIPKYSSPLEHKEALCARVEKMLDNPDSVRLDEVKKIQEEWKKIGKLTDLKDKELNTRFKIACNEIFEYSFLLKSAKTKYEAFGQKTRFEQLKLKIRLLKDSLKEDETILNDFNTERNRYRFAVEQPPMSADHINLINKIKTKQRILKKLQDQLLSNY
jgi:hypothetical protein